MDFIDREIQNEATALIICTVVEMNTSSRKIHELFEMTRPLPSTEQVLKMY